MHKRDEILGKLRARLIAFLMKRFAMPLADSEDVVQQTMVVLLGPKYIQLEEEADLGPLSFEIVRRSRLDFLKMGRRRGEMPEDSKLVSPEPNMQSILTGEHEDAESRAQRWLGSLRDTLPRMSARCRELLTMRLNMYSTDQIASAMNITSNNVAVSEFRCRQEFQKLQPEGSAR